MSALQLGRFTPDQCVPFPLLGYGGASFGTEGPGTGDSWSNAALNK